MACNERKKTSVYNGNLDFMGLFALKKSVLNEKKRKNGIRKEWLTAKFDIYLGGSAIKSSFCGIPLTQSNPLLTCKM